MALKSNGLKNSRRWLKRNNRGVSWWIFCQAFNFSYLSTARPVKSNCHWPEHVTRKGYQVMSDVLVNNLFLSNIVLTICLFIGYNWFWKSEQPTLICRLRAQFMISNTNTCDGVFVVIFFKTTYNKTIFRFGFCDILNNQGLGKCYQRRLRW